ncbi:MAG: glycosyltransferase family 4 protein [Gaiellaceae bacterium]
MSRIVIWSPNYAPELTGIPPLVTDAAEWLARQHRVDVVTALPNYPQRRIFPAYRGSAWRVERRGGVDVARSWLWVRPGERFLDKALYELSFTTLSLPNLVRRLRADTLVVVVPALSAAYVASLLVRARALLPGSIRLVAWVQDLVLSAALSLGGVGGAQRLILEATRSLEQAAFRAADAVVVCSPGFREYALQHGVDPNRVHVVLNWVDLEWIVPRITPQESGITRFLYAGNIGYTQDFDSLVAAASDLGNDVHVRLVGDGNAAEHVRTLVRDLDNITLSGPVPRDEYPALLTATDVHLVLQRRVSAGANFPSKIATALASGRPVLAAIDSTTPAAALLDESGGALIVAPESPSDLADAMRRLRDDPGLRAELGRRGRDYAERSLGRRERLQDLERIVLG